MAKYDALSTPPATIEPLSALILQANVDVQQELVEKQKGGRNSLFKGEEDLITERDDLASKEDVAAFGTTRKRFEIEDVSESGNPTMRTPVPWKAVQDHYKRLQELFDNNEKVIQHLSGVGGGHTGELDELLSLIREARKDQEAQKNSYREELRAQDKEK